MKFLYTLLVVLATAIVAAPAQAVKIDLNAAVPSHFTVTVNKRSDTAWNIALRFTPKGKEPMMRVFDFVVFNNSQKGKGFAEIKFDNKGVPILVLGKTYAFPTEFTRVKMHRALALIGNGHEVVEKVAEKPVPPPPFVSFATKGEAARYALLLVFIGIIIAVVLFVLILSIRKLSDALRTVRTALANIASTEKKPTTTAHQVASAVAPPQTDLQKLQELKVQENSVPLKTLEAKLGPVADPGNSTLAEELYALLAKRTVREVAEAFEAGIIPIMGNQGGPVRWVKMHNIPESAKKHPEWAEKLLGELVVSQKALVQSRKEPGADEKTPDTST